FEIAQPKVFAEAVTGHGFDPAVFAVGSRVVGCAIDEVIQACQYTEGAGQPVITQAVRFVMDVPMPPDAVPHVGFRPIVDRQPVVNKTPLRRGAAVAAAAEGGSPGAGLA